MPQYQGIIQSNDSETVALFQDLGSQLDICMTTITQMPNFLLELQEEDYQVASIDFIRFEPESLKWVKLIRRLRPKIPLIVLCDKIEMNTEARIYEEKIFYLGLRPLDKDILFTVLKSALKITLNSQYEKFRKS